jgi:hypothetical protein
MQSTQDWQGEDLSINSMWRDRPTIPLWNLLPDALMRSCLVEVRHIGIEDTLELLLLQDEQVIQTLSPHTAQKALTDGIGAFRVIRCFQYLDAAGCCHARETRSKLTVTITNEILRPLSIGSRFPQLLCCPCIGRRSGHTDMDDFTGVEINDEEDKKRTEEEIGHLQEIARPDLPGMSL